MSQLPVNATGLSRRELRLGVALAPLLLGLRKQKGR